MTRIRRRRVDTSIERKILIGMIVSTRFCKDIYPLLHYGYFASGYAKRVARWVSDYFSEYQKAPGKHIQDIYEVEKEKLKSDEADIIAIFLQDLSSEYEDAEQFNEAYLLDQSVDYFRERALSVVASNVKNLLGGASSG